METAMNSSYGRARGDLSGAKFCGRVDVYFEGVIYVDPWGRQSIKSETYWTGYGDGDTSKLAVEVAEGPATLSEVRASWDERGIKNSIFERDGVITLSQIIVPQDARGGGIGTAAMNDLVAYADRTGQRVTLSPSADFGGSKSRLVRFYKRFGFVENKGHNKDFTISETMVREPVIEPDVPLYAKGLTGQTAKKDAEYLAAVERGDMEAAQRTPS